MTNKMILNLSACCTFVQRCIYCNVYVLAQCVVATQLQSDRYINRKWAPPKNSPDTGESRNACGTTVIDESAMF